MAPSLTLFFGEDFADSAWAGMAYTLEIPEGDNCHGRGGEWTLGRHPASDLTINIRDVSRHHAAIAYSYAANLWSVSDLGSSKGTVLNGKILPVGDWHPLKIGDRLWLAANLINIVEDEGDTVGTDDGPATVASTEPIVIAPPSPPPAAAAPSPPPPPPARTIGDTAYLAAQWLVSGTTVAGKVYRVVMLAAATCFVVVLIDLAQR